MDSQARAFLDAIALVKGPSLATLPPPEAREIFSGLTNLFLPETDMAEVRDHCSPGGILFRIYRPLGAPEGPLPTVLYLHGGGWVMGNVGTHDTLCRHLANAGQVMVASVDYRLSPEHSFPGPLEDCQEVLHHLVEEAISFGVDTERVAVAGDSAGGNLSAALTIKNRDEQGPSIKAQLLIYPVIDAQCATESYDAYAIDHGLSKDEMLYFWQSYLGDIDGVHPLASPHGGGWVMGNVGTHDTLCRHLANAGQVMVASVDYRLSPEHSFPGPLEDCQEVLHHLVEEAISFGVDTERVAVAGDSAGGNLSAALTIKNRDEQGPSIKAQLLIYPVIDAQCATESYDAYAIDHGLSKDEMLYFWQSYLGDIDGVHPLASPNQTLDLAGLPSARVITAEYDILRDEGEAYAEQLKAAGVSVELERYDGLIHGFFHFAGMMGRGREAVEKEGQWLGEQLRG